MPEKRKRPLSKGEVPNYVIDIEDEVEDMGLGDLFDEQPVLPESEKQLVPKPPTYEESLTDILEGKKEIYVDPQYFPQDPQELPPEYDDDEGVDCTIDDDDELRETLKDIGTDHYDDVDYKLQQPKMTPKKNSLYLGKIIKDSEEKWYKLRSMKTEATKKYKSGVINESEKHEIHERSTKRMNALKEYINHYKDKMDEVKKGYGIKSRRRKRRGGSAIFFNDPKQLLKRLELIIGELTAGNTSIQMRNMGVNILNTLLKMATINRPQYNKIYKNYFSV